MGYLNNEQQLTVDKNGITVNSGYLSLSGSILTSNTIDRLNSISNTNLLSTNNTWSGIQNFTAPITVTSINTISATILSYLNSVSSNIQTQFNNISTTIDNKISSALTTFVNSDHAYVSTGGSSFTGNIIFTGSSKGQNITLNNGNLSFSGLPAASNAISVASGVSNFQAITATTINSIALASVSTVNSIYKSTYGVGMRSQTYLLSNQRDFTATDFSSDQLIMYNTNQIRYPVLNIPSSQSTEGQRLTIINFGAYDLKIGSNSFIGKGQSGTSFLISSNQIFELISGYTWWVVVSIN
jgi:hypothetical protein